ncbi:Hsp20/alpha crystallin family protein [Halorussus vallis]|nr:Hsp20/alpha crystallin family protein [Halorussus vallis]USZ76387.1 Hsp20/alpha crystallin family protein [Halorussus vallis]
MPRGTRPSKRRGRRPRESERAAAIPIDVAERGDEYVLTADVPGLRKQDIDVRVRKNRVQIVVDPAERDDGETEGERAENRGPFARRARRRGPVSRTVELPRWVDEERTNAEYQNGSLKVTLPKRRRGRSVEIR